MSLIEVNTGAGWYDLPTPKPEGYFPSYTHLENSFRDARGYLHRDIIRMNTAKLECSWNALSKEELRKIQELYGYYSFRMRYTDCYGNRVEKIMYAGQLSGKILSIDHENYAPDISTGISMNFIEY